MTFNIFTAKRISCFRQYDRIDDLIPCDLRGDKCPVLRQFLVDEFHLPAVFKFLDPLFVPHGRSSSRESQSKRLPDGLLGACLIEKEAPYSDYLTTPRNENCGCQQSPAADSKPFTTTPNPYQQHLQKTGGNTRRSKQD